MFYSSDSVGRFNSETCRSSAYIKQGLNIHYKAVCLEPVAQIHAV